MILYMNFVVFRRSRKSNTPKIISVHQGRVSIHKEKEKAGIIGVVSSKGLFCSLVRLWNVGVDVSCTKRQFT